MLILGCVEEVGCVSQILLRGGDLGSSVDETDMLIKRHEAFDKLVNSQEDKVCNTHNPLQGLWKHCLH